MEKNCSPSLLGDKSEEEAKSEVGVYRFQGILRREFSDIDQARKYAASLARKYPNVLFFTYTERRSGIDRRIGNERRSGNERRTGTYQGKCKDRRIGIDRRTALVG